MMSAPLSLYILSFLPIIMLILVSMEKGVKKAAIISFLLTTILFFYWQNPVNFYFASLVSASVITLGIIMIVFGAIFLFNAMQSSGLIEKIGHSLDSFHPSKEIRFFLLAFSLTTLFEGVAGFGTPGALVPFLLVSLGFDAVMSVAIVLLLDALVVTFGAVGTPIYLGLKSTLHLAAWEAARIGFIAGLINTVSGFIMLWFIFRLYEKYEGKMRYKKDIIVLFLFLIIPFVLISYFLPEFPSVLSPIIMLFLSYLYLHQSKTKLKLGSWIPYGVLVILLLLPKLIPQLNSLLSWNFTLSNIFNTSISSSFSIFKSPLFPFLMVGVGLLLFYKNKGVKIKDTSIKTVSAFGILFPVVAIAQLMVHSDAVLPSMINLIAQTFSYMGKAGYILAAPFIGITGAFVTGSNTVSNIIFGPAHIKTAELLGLDKIIVLSLQTVGGALGNAICLFNIITAAVVVHLKRHGEVLKINLFPTLLAGASAAVLGILMLYFINF